MSAAIPARETGTPFEHSPATQWFGHLIDEGGRIDFGDAEFCWNLDRNSGAVRNVTALFFPRRAIEEQRLPYHHPAVQLSNELIEKFDFSGGNMLQFWNNRSGVRFSGVPAYRSARDLWDVLNNHRFHNIGEARRAKHAFARIRGCDWIADRLVPVRVSQPAPATLVEVR